MRVLVTGGSGFLGAWIIRRLHCGGHEVRIFDLATDRRIVTAVAGEEAAAAAEWVAGDIVTTDEVKSAASGCDAIVHLAGVLTPFCAQNPIRGAEINLIGTLNVFEAARTHGTTRVVYTSSAGVYGPDDGHAPYPMTHYGAFKLACEGSARAYWADHKLGSFGFRPYIVYGPGRESGLTAGPSLACRAAVRGEAYTIPYKGTAGLVFVDDVAAAYVSAALRVPDGAHVVNMVGQLASNDDVVAEIRRVVPDARIEVSGPVPPFAPDVDPGDVARILPGVPATSLRDGIAQTI
ncbi:MAG: SDR family oxidoreductase, partial [Hyphomicrobiaceae bacterium]